MRRRKMSSVTHPQRDAVQPDKDVSKVGPCVRLGPNQVRSMNRLGVNRFSELIAFDPFLPNVLALETMIDPNQGKSKNEHAPPSENMEPKQK